MHNKQPYSFEKTDVRGRFLLNFSCTKVQSKDVSPIAGNVFALGAVADFGAVNCQATTKVDARHDAELTTKPAIEPNACYALVAVI